MEYKEKMHKKSEECTQKETKQIQNLRNDPSVSHLLFADDSLILMKADASNAACLNNCLYSYCASYGQLVSDSKSSIYFSPNTTVDHRNSLPLPYLPSKSVLLQD